MEKIPKKSFPYRRFFFAAAICGCLCFTGDDVVFSQGDSWSIDARVRPAVCGNSIKEGGEQCDGNDITKATCRTLGFFGGSLGCNPSCDFDVSGCERGATSSGGGAAASGTGITSGPSAPATVKNGAKGDINGDGKINLIDFSIAAYWYKRPFVEAAMTCDLNSDGRIDLADFSIMAYYWAG